MRIARQGVSHEHHVVLPLGEDTIGFIFHVDGTQSAAQFQAKRSVGGYQPNGLGPGPANRGRGYQ
jgi:hypothetical protein